MNKSLLVGRLTKDPDVREGNTTVARFTLAVDRKFAKEGEQSADFISCIAFGKTADFINKYFAKGMRMGLEGRIQTGSYTNKNGQKVYTTDVVAEQVEFVESKKESAPQPQPDDDGFMQIPDDVDELPFN